jgi:hypothetical protein
MSGQLHAPTALPLRKAIPVAIGLGGWVCPRAGVGHVEKRKFLTLSRLELRPLGRPARSQSLYSLRYPGSSKLFIQFFKKNTYIYAEREREYTYSDWLRAERLEFKSRQGKDFKPMIISFRKITRRVK